MPQNLEGSAELFLFCLLKYVMTPNFLFLNSNQNILHVIILTPDDINHIISNNAFINIFYSINHS